jgi:hypothetical protein
MTENEKPKVDVLKNKLNTLNMLSIIAPIPLNFIFAMIFTTVCSEWDSLYFIYFPILGVIQIYLIIILVLISGAYFKKDKRNVSKTLSIIALVLSLAPPVVLYLLLYFWLVY